MHTGFWHTFLTYFRLDGQDSRCVDWILAIHSVGYCLWTFVATQFWRGQHFGSTCMHAQHVCTWNLWHRKGKHCVISSFMSQASCKAIKKLVSPELTFFLHLDTGVSCGGLHGFSFQQWLTQASLMTYLKIWFRPSLIESRPFGGKCPLLHCRPSVQELAHMLRSKENSWGSARVLEKWSLNQDWRYSAVES